MARKKLRSKRNWLLRFVLSVLLRCSRWRPKLLPPKLAIFLLVAQWSLFAVYVANNLRRPGDAGDGGWGRVLWTIDDEVDGGGLSSILHRLHHSIERRNRSLVKQGSISSGKGFTAKLSPEIGNPRLDEFARAFGNLSSMRRMFEIPPKKLLCMLKRRKPGMMSKSSRILDEAPYARKFMPARPFLGGQHYKTCAVVSNAKAAGQRSQGQNIDAHDLVVRLHDAPTLGFESSVGKRRADVRIFGNHLTKLLAVDSASARNFTALDADRKAFMLTWDHCCCGYRHFSYCVAYPTEDSLEKLDLAVYNNDVDHQVPPVKHHNGIGEYLARRRAARAERYYMLEFDYIWELWEIVQRVYPYEVERDPPSHSFIAIATMMHFCDTVRAFDFLPSRLNPANLHNFYYESRHNLDTLRRVGKDGGLQQQHVGGHADFSRESVRTSFHLKLEEIAFLYLANMATPESVFNDGVGVFPGMADVHC